MVFTAPKIGNNIETAEGFYDIQAAATALDGSIVMSDFNKVVSNYLRQTTVLWPLLRKEPAEADVVREIAIDSQPLTGFFSKIDLNPPEGLMDAHNLTDPGQAVKAGGGAFRVGNYWQSLYEQQGRPYGDIYNDQTTALIRSTGRTLESALFVGNATTNPLQFNGLGQQMAAGHAFTADTTANDSVIDKIQGICNLAIDDPVRLGAVTHIFTSALGLRLIQREAQQQVQYVDLENIRVGLRVPGIITQASKQGEPTPIITSPYIRDIDNGANPDEVVYWILDMESIVWKGVYPHGGERTFEPQVFDVSTYTGSAYPYLLEKRFCLFYGTLYCRDRGRGVWKLTVKVPSGMVGGI